MPWTTPTLKQVRLNVRDDVTAALGGAVKIGNGVLRVMADAMAGLGHLALRYIDWLARQLLPDTAETEWLDRHADIWLINSDSSIGRKNATLATGVVTITGTIIGTLVASGTQMESSAGIGYETTEQVSIGAGPTEVAVRALDAGAAANLGVGETLGLNNVGLGIDSTATVVVLEGGVDEEEDDQLRSRVLLRIRQPPMGGDADDYVQWALSIPGVTRAWAAPNEMGIGTVTVRFMMDELRATSSPLTNGFPIPADVDAVEAVLQTLRPVAIKDFFVEAPLPEPIDFTIDALEPDDLSTRAAIEASVSAALTSKASPAFALNGVLQTPPIIYAAWVSEAIMAAPGVEHFTLVMVDHPMPDNGHMGVLGTVTYT